MLIPRLFPFVRMVQIDPTNSRLPGLGSCPSIRPLLAPRPPSSAGLRLLGRPDHLPFRVADLPLPSSEIALSFVRKHGQVNKQSASKTRSGLAANDLVVLDASRGVARVDYQLCVLNDLFVVVIGVVSDDEHTVVLA
jgi:hypothetical protein